MRTFTTTLSFNPSPMSTQISFPTSIRRRALEEQQVRDRKDDEEREYPSLSNPELPSPQSDVKLDDLSLIKHIFESPIDDALDYTSLDIRTVSTSSGALSHIYHCDPEHESILKFTEFDNSGNKCVTRFFSDPSNHVIYKSYFYIDTTINKKITYSSNHLSRIITSYYPNGKKQNITLQLLSPIDRESYIDHFIIFFDYEEGKIIHQTFIHPTTL